MSEIKKRLQTFYKALKPGIVSAVRIDARELFATIA